MCSLLLLLILKYNGELEWYDLQLLFQIWGYFTHSADTEQILHTKYTTGAASTVENRTNMVVKFTS